MFEGALTTKGESPPGICSYVLIEQAVAGTVPQQPAMDGGQPRLQLPLWIQPPQQQGVSPQQGKKGKIVFLLDRKSTRLNSSHMA